MGNRVVAASTDRSSRPGLPQPGQVVVGRYRIDGALGEGGMGAVLAAHDLVRDEPVALKVLLPDQTAQADATKRFVREAEAARAIDNPHVARLIDVGTLEQGLPFMVLELLVGQPLDAVIRERAPLAVTEAVDLLLQACEGVACAHARGIIHRDLKPSNLFGVAQPDGSVLIKVLDFGIAKATPRLDWAGDGHSLTESGSTLGSPEYMSPEQLRSSKSVDVRTDIWSLGLILFKLLTGKPAFAADTVGAHFAAILSDAPTPLRAARPDAPAALEEAIGRCLRKSAAGRYQDVGQLCEDLVIFASPAAAATVVRIRELLDEAGASAATGPDEAPSRRLPGDAPAPTSWRPSGPMARTKAMPALPRGARRSRRRGALAAAAVLGAGVLAIVGYRWLGARADAGGGVSSTSPRPLSASVPGASAGPPGPATAYAKAATAVSGPARPTLPPPDGRGASDPTMDTRGLVVLSGVGRAPSPPPATALSSSVPATPSSSPRATSAAVSAPPASATTAPVLAPPAVTPKGPMVDTL